MEPTENSVRHDGVRRRLGVEWTFERKVLVATLCTSVAGFTFGLGANWAQISGQERRIAELESFRRDRLPSEYLPREIYNTDQRYLTEAIRQLNETLRDMQRDHRNKTP